MSVIRVRTFAYMLALFPGAPPAGESPRGATLRALANGLAVPSFWHESEVRDAFAEANRIWLREAEIVFEPVTIESRDEFVPPDETWMWRHFVNNLPPAGGRCIACGFVYELPGAEAAADGGWGGGRVAIVASRTARSGVPGFAGNLLAHEIGHILLGPDHVAEPSALMYERRNPRVANAGLLVRDQRERARTRAALL